jgi:tol-pal system protein YbgF
MKYYLSTFVALFVLTGNVQARSADDFESERLDDRLGNIERNLNSMQKQFYKSGGKITGSGSYDDSGSSPKTEVRIDALEEQIRGLVGRIEENQYVINNALQEIKKLSADVDYRLNEIEQRAKSAPVQNASLPTDQEDLDDPKLVAKMEKTTREGVESLDENGQYERAFEYLRNSDYGKAEVALREFIAKNKQSHLASNAYYWLGETYYIRENYEKSAVNFLKGYQDKPKGNKAPDSLLKLGMSLNKLNKPKEACTTYSKLLSEFPKIEVELKEKISKQQKTAKCS